MEGRRSLLRLHLDALVRFWAIVAVGVARVHFRCAEPARYRNAVAAMLISPSSIGNSRRFWWPAWAASLDLKKLLVYPRPHENLFLGGGDVARDDGIRDASGPDGAAAGLLRNPLFGGRARAPRILAPLLLFLFSISARAGLRSLIERLLGRRHLRKCSVWLVMLGALPQLLISPVPKGMRKSCLRRIERAWPWVSTVASPCLALPWHLL